MCHIQYNQSNKRNSKVRERKKVKVEEEKKKSQKYLRQTTKRNCEEIGVKSKESVMEKHLDKGWKKTVMKIKNASTKIYK